MRKEVGVVGYRGKIRLKRGIEVLEGRVRSAGIRYNRVGLILRKGSISSMPKPSRRSTNRRRRRLWTYCADIWALVSAGLPGTPATALGMRSTQQPEDCEIEYLRCGSHGGSSGGRYLS
jgi:hypothetical protein